MSLTRLLLSSLRIAALSRRSRVRALGRQISWRRILAPGEHFLIIDWFFLRLSVICESWMKFKSPQWRRFFQTPSRIRMRNVLREWARIQLSSLRSLPVNHEEKLVHFSGFPCSVTGRDGTFSCKGEADPILFMMILMTLNHFSSSRGSCSWRVHLQVSPLLPSHSVCENGNGHLQAADRHAGDLCEEVSCSLIMFTLCSAPLFDLQLFWYWPLSMHHNN